MGKGMLGKTNRNPYCCVMNLRGWEDTWYAATGHSFLERRRMLVVAWFLGRTGHDIRWTMFLVALLWLVRVGALYRSRYIERFVYSPRKRVERKWGHQGP